MGCASDAHELGTDPVATHAPLFVHTGTTMWPTNTIPVCFMTRWVPDGPRQGRLESSEPCFATMTARIRANVEQIFERAPGVQLDFTGWGVCPHNINSLPMSQRLDINGGDSSDVTDAAAALTPTFVNGIRVGIQCDYLDDNGNLVRDTNGWQSGTGYPNGGQVRLWTSQSKYAWPYGFDAATIHEFAHALGFSHEFDRTDQPNEHCQAHWVAGPEHAVGYPYDGPGTHSGDFITVYDYNSVTNDTYCVVPNSGSLSPIDRAGLAVSYPTNTTYLRPQGGYSLEANGGLLVRDDDALLPSLMQQGLTTVAYPDVTYELDSGNAYEGHALPMTLGDFDQPVNVEIRATDFLGRNLSGPAVPVVRDNAGHTALLMAALR